MEKQHVCPWWLGYTFILPTRKYQHNPETILGPHISEGMTVMDYGCAMGYFSLPMARMTGEKGILYCVDIQKKMLDKLQSRANKAGVGNILSRLVGKDFNPDELVEKLDFTLLFAVVHEVPNQQQLFNDIFKMTKQGGKVLFAEPKGHVKTENFEKSLLIAKSAGFHVSDEKPMTKGLCALLMKD